MRKLIFSTMAIMLIASSVAFAQKTRTLGVYFDATAGNVNQSKGVATIDGDTTSGTTPQKLFAGNEFEFGVYYRQNFEAAQWLTFQMKALVVTTQEGVYEPDTVSGPVIDGTKYTVTTKPGKYKGMGDFGINIGNTVQTPRAQIGLMLNSESLGFDGLYVGLYFDTRTLAAFELMYTLGLGNAGGLTFGTIVEFWANPLTESKNYVINGESKIDYAYAILDVFEIRVAYSLPFAEIWGFTTQLGFRFQGPGDVSSGGLITKPPTYQNIKIWEENFASRLQIRWENTLSVNAGGLGLWARVRYNLNNVAAGRIQYNKDYAGGTDPVAKYVDLDIMHEVVLQAGISYSFDLSAL